MIINFRKFEVEHNGLMFQIEEDFPEVGVYLYVYQNEECIKDFLQNSIDVCKRLALEDYGVPLEKWFEKGDSKVLQ
jgi:hypothetical protein